MYPLMLKRKHSHLHFGYNRCFCLIVWQIDNVEFRQNTCDTSRNGGERTFSRDEPKEEFVTYLYD